MTTPAFVTLDHYAGDAFSVTFKFESTAGVAIDISTWALAMKASDRNDGTVTTMTLGGASLSAGLADFSMIAATMLANGLDVVGRHAFDLYRGDIGKTWVAGDLMTAKNRAV